MRILFLDDDPKRWRAFRQNMSHPDLTVEWAKNAPAAISLLNSKEHFTWVFLDHDLAEEHYQTYHNGGEYADGTGRDVVKWIVQNPERFQNTHFIVHSLNPDGAAWMSETLNRAGLRAKQVPFAWQTVKYTGRVGG